MKTRIRNYLLRHAQVFFYSLGQLVRAPVATLMTASVIGITLALPSGLYALIGNLERLSSGWEGGGQISLFLSRDIPPQTARKLAERIRSLPAVARVDYISPDAALVEFKRMSGFGDALDALGENPLPAVLVVHPAAEQSQPERIQALVRDLGRYKEVDLAQFDFEWVRRLHAILRIAERGVWILALLLAAAVLLIVGNTVRLAVLNRREEIEIVKLIGGTNAFIRRPFLYSGLLQGLLGGAVAWILVSVSLLLLAGPARELATLYGSRFAVVGLGPRATLALLGTGGLLGWLGSRLAVGWHLHAIDPR